MKRRDFLASTLIATATTALQAQQPSSSSGGSTKPPPKWRGVNLGGWLALEKWITPGVYAGFRPRTSTRSARSSAKPKRPSA